MFNSILLKKIIISKNMFDQKYMFSMGVCVVLPFTSNKKSNVDVISFLGGKALFYLYFKQWF